MRERALASRFDRNSKQDGAQIKKGKKNISKYVDSVWCLRGRGQQPNRMANRSFLLFFCFCSFPSLRSEHVTACYMAHIPGRCGHKLTVLCRCLVMDVTRMGPHLHVQAHRLCADGLITQWRVFMDSCKSSGRVSLDQVDRIRFHGRLLQFFCCCSIRRNQKVMAKLQEKNGR